MKLLYYTAGMTGAGHVVRGMAIGNALTRRGIDCSYLLLSTNPFACLADSLGINHIGLPVEQADRLSLAHCHDSALYRCIVEEQPDVLIVDHFWFTLYHFLPELPCRKVFICRQIADTTFRVDLPGGTLVFQPADYDLVLGIEPFRSGVITRFIDPIVLRNRHEILSRPAATERLSLDFDGKACLYALNGRPGEFEERRDRYAYLEDAGYAMIYSTNYETGGESLFPAVDYFNAFDLVICGAGYNAFWEAVYFKKEAVFVPFPRINEDQARRIEECQQYEFDKNGADEIVDLILKM